MSAQHTPGPWTTDGVLIKSPSGLIAHVYPDNGDANARLIAAAPELLAVLRRVQPHLEGQRDRYAKIGLDAAFEDYENLIQATRAVIARLDGR